MTPVQIGHLRRSFAQIEHIAPQAAALLYENLFTVEPGLRHLFQGNLTQQGSRLMTALGIAVDLLDEPDALTPMLRKLGARHVNYGVQDQHYASLGAALFKALRQTLGRAYTDEVHAAWVTLYHLISATMMDAAHRTSSARAA